MSPTAVVSAPAKVNLRLRVLGRRTDGYHDIDTLFQAIDLADDVSVRLGDPGVRLDVAGAGLGPVTDNLAHRAAARLMAEVAFDGGCDIRLVKRIPAGAGLGASGAAAAPGRRLLLAILVVALFLLWAPSALDQLGHLGLIAYPTYEGFAPIC